MAGKEHIEQLSLNDGIANQPTSKPKPEISKINYMYLNGTKKQLSIYSQEYVMQDYQ
jgi:hypothetical protein